MTTEHDRTTLGQAVEDYYAAYPLPEDRLRGLLDKANSRGHGGHARWSWIAGGALASAAALFILALTIGFSGRVATPAPNLVAVQIHADWCARAPEVAPIFAELLTQYGNEPVLFVTLDITDDVRREQAQLLARSLGIPQAMDEPFESGMIKLLDRDSHTLLASITGRGDSKEFELRLAKLLDAAKNNRPKERI